MLSLRRRSLTSLIVFGSRRGSARRYTAPPMRGLGVQAEQGIPLRDLLKQKSASAISPPAPRSALLITSAGTRAQLGVHERGLAHDASGIHTCTCDVSCEAFPAGDVARQELWDARAVRPGRRSMRLGRCCGTDVLAYLLHCQEDYRCTLAYGHLNRRNCPAGLQDHTHFRHVVAASFRQRCWSCNPVGLSRLGRLRSSAESEFLTVQDCTFLSGEAY